MSNYNLYSVNVSFNIVVAALKDRVDISEDILKTLKTHIASICTNDIAANDISFSKINNSEDLPEGWGEYALPYHRYAQDPDDLREVTIGDILDSNKELEKQASEHTTQADLLLRVKQLEALVKKLTSLI